MNIVDVVIIMGLLLGGVTGLKNGFFRQSVVLVGAILCFVLAWFFKDFIANFLSFTLPFFNFAGPFEGLTSLNIVMYQLVAFMLLLFLFSAILTVIIRMTGVFEKILNITIILGIPSKILGFIVGAIEAYIILFAILFFVNQPAINLDIVNDSTLAPKIVNSSPVLSNIVGDMNDAINDIYDITKSYHVNQNVDTFNRKVIDALLEHDVIDRDYLDKLVSKGKINY